MDNGHDRALPPALSLLHSHRPRNVSWIGAAGLLFGDWGTSRLYVLGLAFLVAGRSSFWLIAAMSLLILAVGWAYTQICRIYPDGGGVYTAAKQRSRLLGVIGALLLFADYTVTASLSAVEAFHYFGLGKQHEAHVAADSPADKIGPDEIVIPDPDKPTAHETLWSWRSPGLWALVSIVVIGAFNLLGPKHTAAYAIFAAVGMMIITLLIVAFALPQVDWAHLHVGVLRHHPMKMWEGFVFIVLALSGVEAIANLTGVMKKPVYNTARMSIWSVAMEVALFNLLLAVAMVALASLPEPLSREAHKEDMLAYLARFYTQPYIGALGEWSVRIIGGLLLLSATNTAVNGLMSITYVMSRDNEMPGFMQKLNGFGSPWVGAIVAAGVPAVILLFAHDLETLASLYAIGVVGAVAINCTLCAFHPRLRKRWRKVAMLLLGVLLVAIWVTLAATKLSALIFVSIVLAVGLILRQITKTAAKRRPKPSLLRQAIMEQLTPEALGKKKILLATAGSDDLADPALEIAQKENASLLVCFVRQVALSYKVEAGERTFTLDTDPAAQVLFTDFLAHGHRYGVPIIPIYDTGPDASVLIAEQAAVNAADKVVIGSSRRGAIHHLIKGSFQRRIESLLPPEMRVVVVSPPERGTSVGAVSAVT
ncbi:MAG TPA: universal stress protein [Tepidisphaeraceae bacterium]|jgi:amino acid transporter/nucleotide-binding universal stress UspA family protein